MYAVSKHMTLAVAPRQNGESQDSDRFSLQMQGESQVGFSSSLDLRKGTWRLSDTGQKMLLGLSPAKSSKRCSHASSLTI